MAWKIAGKSTSCASQLELSERRGQLRASRAACVETRARVESLAARLASAHNAEPVGMIWQNPQVGKSVVFLN